MSWRMTGKTRIFGAAALLAACGSASTKTLTPEPSRPDERANCGRTLSGRAFGCGGEPSRTATPPGVPFSLNRGDCSLPSAHDIPFGRSDAERILCGAHESLAIDAMDHCLGRLSACRSESERAWLHEVENCISLASRVSDRCLAALIDPVRPRL